MGDILYIVIPCYNEEEALPVTYEKVRQKLDSLMDSGKISGRSKVAFVNDGSKDSTWSIIKDLCERDRHVAGVSLSRNRGHQNALLAGLMAVREKADMVISMDADLQDDIDAIDKMVECYYEGCDVVYGVRDSRKKDTFFKRFTAEGYYKLLEKMGCEVVFNHADYRLMSRRAVTALSKYKEQDLFLRGILPMIGYKSDIVTYERGERVAGESKYPLRKMLSLAASGVTSLSMKPLRFIVGAGVVMLMLSIVLLIGSLISLCFGHTMLDWKIVVFSIWFVGGAIMTAVGVVGEYVGKTFLEAKRRPRYIIEEYIDRD